jgi:hypothetical protein
VLNAINIAGIVGANVRDDLWVIEFVCKDEATVDIALNNPFTVEGKTPVEAILPRHKANKLILIKIANVPFGQKEDLQQAIAKHWSTYGKVLDVQPYQFPGRPWLTKRWDVLLQLNEGEKKLNASPVFNIDGYTDTLISTWNGAKKACLRCLSAGHSTSKCTINNPKIRKVGESANPLQKIDGGVRSQKRKETGSKVSPGKPEASTSATTSATTPTTTATSTTSASTDMEVEAIVAQKPDAPTPSTSEQVGVDTYVGNPDCSTDNAHARHLISGIASMNYRGFDTYEEYMRARPVDVHQSLVDLYANLGSEHYSQSSTSFAGQRTPPTFEQQEIVDPDTPRKGRKRQAKEDIWTPTLAQVREKLLQLKLCCGCWTKGHVVTNCNRNKRGSLTEKNLGSVLRHPKFKPLLAAWSHARQQQGMIWKLDDSEVVIVPACTKCHKEGHIAPDCLSHYVCTHCKGDHLRMDCPSAPPYAYEQ